MKSGKARKTPNGSGLFQVGTLKGKNAECIFSLNALLQQLFLYIQLLVKYRKPM